MSITNFDELWYKCSFRKNNRHVFFSTAIVDVKGVKTTLKVIMGRLYISSNISEITKDTVLCKLMKLMKFNGVYHLFQFVQG